MRLATFPLPQIAIIMATRSTNTLQDGKLLTTASTSLVQVSCFIICFTTRISFVSRSSMKKLKISKLVHNPLMFYA